MGRNSDKLYLSAKEHAEGPRGYKGPSIAGGAAPGAVPHTQQAGRALLPLTHCALTLQPWRDPVCAPDGAIFDVTAAMPYVRKHGKHPLTGAPLTLGDLTPLNFHREGGGGGGGALACPVTGRVFTTSSRLVAVRTTGNVFAAEAVEELCAATRNWRDLLTDEPFAGRKDLIELRPATAAGAAGAAGGGGGDSAAAAAGAGVGGGNVRSGASDDVKRALAALGTAEASNALARGGGGAAMEAARQAAQARVQQQQPKQQQPGNARGGAGAGRGGGGAKDGEEEQQEDEEEDDAPPAPPGDWRLRGEAPRARGDVAVFKPGAGTWDTSQYYGDAAALRRAERQKEVQAILDNGGAVGGTGPSSTAAGGGATAAAAASSAGALPQGANPATKPDGSPRPVPRRWYERRSGHARFETGVETTGAAARGFTSTVAPAAPVNALVRRRVAWKPAPGTKAYARLKTTHGDLNLELHAGLCPLACENFLALCAMGYYDGVAFHRLVRHLCLQGGDPTETGRGGESIFAVPEGRPGAGGAAFFPDEIDERLRHDGRGVLAMANGGKNSNGSQFYVALKSARHLDGKHTVFGRVVGGLETLTRIERLAQEGGGGGGGEGGGAAAERPRERVAIVGAEVFVNPFLALAKEWDEARAAAKEAKEAKEGGGGGGVKRAAPALAPAPAPAPAAAAAAAAAAAPPPPKRRAAPSALDAW